MSNYVMVSFDIFDTLITRKTATPKGIFAIVAQKINNLEFIPLRTYAEYRANTIARDTYAKEDTDIYDIYNTMKDFANAYDMEEWMNIEIETEIEMSVPIRKNIELALDYIKKGTKVVFISDMYLPSSVIKKMLVNAEPTFEDIDIFVSGKYGKIKSTGNLYKTVKEKYKIEYTNWIHHGDNIESDVKAAKKLGIKTEHLVFENSGQKEEFVLNNRESDASFQLSIGISRNLRNFGKPLLSYSCGVFYGGIILLDYTWTILKKSKKMGFETLYFIARDGYIPKMIADFLIENFKLDIKTRYLHISIASINDAFEFKEKMEVVTEYLNQEIDKNEKFAFVDIGGGGGTVNTIGHLIEKDNVYTFFLVYNMPNLHRYNDKERIVKIIVFSQCPYYFISASWYLEILFTAPHGRTTGYAREENRIVPIMQENDIGELYPEYNDYIKGVMDFAYAFTEYIDIYPLNAVSFAVMNSIINNEDYINFFGNMPHEIYERFSKKLSIIERLDLSLLNIENTHLPLYPYGTGFQQKIFGAFVRLRGTLFANLYKYVRIFFAKISKRSYNFFSSWNRNLFQKNIVLYGSGIEGKRLHSLILINNMCKIVLWSDKENRNIDQIPKKEFDYVLIAIKDICTVKEVTSDLVSMGISKDKIYSSEYGKVL